jgi:dCMP deaminase
MTNKWDLRFLALAKLVSTWSKDPSTQTGAVITDGMKGVISVGFNGFPAGMPDDPALYANREEKYSRIIHCEVNALIYARRDVIGATLYTYPFLSCDRCCVQMLQAGVVCFVAPKATAEQLERWGPAFERTRRYISECGADYLEIDLERQN